MLDKKILKNLSTDEILFGFWGYWTSWIHRCLEVETDKEMVKDFGSGFVTRLGCLVVGLKDLSLNWLRHRWLKCYIWESLDKLNSRWLWSRNEQKKKNNKKRRKFLYNRKIHSIIIHNKVSLKTHIYDKKPTISLYHDEIAIHSKIHSSHESHLYSHSWIMKRLPRSNNHFSIYNTKDRLIFIIST